MPDDLITKLTLTQNCRTPSFAGEQGGKWKLCTQYTHSRCCKQVLAAAMDPRRMWPAAGRRSVRRLLLATGGRLWAPSAAAPGNTLCTWRRRSHPPDAEAVASSFTREDGRLYPASQMDTGLVQIPSGRGGDCRPRAIDAAEMQERLDADGVVALRGVFDHEWIADLVGAMEEVGSDPGQGVVVGAQTDSAGGAWAEPKFLQYALGGTTGRSERLLRLIRSPAAANLAATALQPLHTDGARVSFQSDDLFIKEPCCMERTPWHRDTSCVPFSSPGNGERLLNVWIAADDMPASTSLRVLAGSHKWLPGRVGCKLQEDFTCAALGEGWREAAGRVLPLPETLAEADRQDFILTFALEQMDLMDPSAFETYMLPISYNLKAGDCVVFHRQAIHGSNGNSTDTPRRALSMRWSTAPKAHPTNTPRYTQKLC